jgi:peroxiredoxin
MKLFGKRRAKMKTEDLSGEHNSHAQPTSPLSPGTRAPDFSLLDSTKKEISLRELRGQPLILAFYPADWSPTCGDQLTLYNEVLPLFEEHNAQLLGISVDGNWSHRAYSESRGLNFPLLSDFEPKGAVARTYGVYDAQKGTSQRALFVIDSEGIIRWSYLSPSNVNPGANGILEALESLDE